MDSDNYKPTQLPRVTSLNDSDLFIVSIDVGTAPKTRVIEKSKAIVVSGGGGFNQGFMTNGKIAVSVASNNLTVALKTLAGADPSAGDKVQIRIGDTVRDITSALSVTKNAGTNWCNAGSAELATKEIDYFVYVGYNATDGITIGFSRISYANLYSDFSTTTTNEKYCAISTITNAAAGNNYVNIGRFAATLSAGAGYTWTVPTFTSANLIQRPVYESRINAWAPQWTGFSVNPGYTSLYQIVGKTITYYLYATSNGTSNATTTTMTLPFTAVASSMVCAFGCQDNGATQTAFGDGQTVNGSATMNLYKTFFNGAWTASGVKIMYFTAFTIQL